MIHFWGEALVLSCALKHKWHLWSQSCRLGTDRISLFSTISGNGYWKAEHDWYDWELLLGVRFFELSHCSIPAGTFYLETEYVSTFLGRLLVIRIPVEFLLDVSLNIEFVKLLLLLSRVYLLDSSKERLRIEQSVDENNARNSCWVFFPIV